MFKVTIKTGGIKYRGSGKTIESALDKIGLSWEKIKMKSVVEVTDGKRSHEHLFNIVQLRRIFSNKIVKGFWAKNLEKLMK